jgi:hypothetical protein
MRKIEKYYLSHVIFYAVILTTVMIALHLLLILPKELEHLSQTYNMILLEQYLLTESINLLIELAPITLFIGTIITHWQWAQKSLWLSAALSGQNTERWVRTVLILMLLTTTTLLGVKHWYTIIAPSVIEARARALESESLEKTASNSLELMGNYIFYAHPSGTMSIFDREKKEIRQEQDSAEFYQHYQEQQQIKKELALGLSSIPLDKKLSYKKLASGSERRLLSGGIIKDFFYPLSLITAIILGWRDSPIGWTNRSYKLSPLKITFSLICLYMPLKIIPIATLFYPSHSVIINLAGVLLIAFLLKPPSTQQR